MDLQGKGAVWGKDKSESGSVILMEWQGKWVTLRLKLLRFRSNKFWGWKKPWRSVLSLRQPETVHAHSVILPQSNGCLFPTLGQAWGCSPGLSLAGQWGSHLSPLQVALSKPNGGSMVQVLEESQLWWVLGGKKDKYLWKVNQFHKRDSMRWDSGFQTGILGAKRKGNSQVGGEGCWASGLSSGAS